MLEILGSILGIVIQRDVVPFPFSPFSSYFHKGTGQTARFILGTRAIARILGIDRSWIYIRIFRPLIFTLQILCRRSFTGYGAIYLIIFIQLVIFSNYLGGLGVGLCFYLIFLIDLGRLSIWFPFLNLFLNILGFGWVSFPFLITNEQHLTLSLRIGTKLRGSQICSDPKTRTRPYPPATPTIIHILIDRFRFIVTFL